MAVGYQGGGVVVEGLGSGGWRGRGGGGSGAEEGWEGEEVAG